MNIKEAISALDEADDVIREYIYTSKEFKERDNPKNWFYVNYIKNVDSKEIDVNIANKYDETDNYDICVEVKQDEQYN